LKKKKLKNTKITKTLRQSKILVDKAKRDKDNYRSNTKNFFLISNVVYQKNPKGHDKYNGYRAPSSKAAQKQTLDTKAQPGKQPNQTQKNSPKKNT
jgi:hypothetical protein